MGCSCLSSRSGFIKTPAGNGRRKDLLTGRRLVLRCSVRTSSASPLNPCRSSEYSVPLARLVMQQRASGSGSRIEFETNGPLLVRPEAVTPRLQIICSFALVYGFVQTSASSICCHEPSIVSAAHNMMSNDKQMQDAKSSILSLALASLSTVVQEIVDMRAGTLCMGVVLDCCMTSIHAGVMEKVQLVTSYGKTNYRGKQVREPIPVCILRDTAIE
jgi:hypothetical protein